MILVTGSTGFIGKALCERLTSENNEIIPVVRNTTCQKNEIIVEDIGKFQGWGNALDGVKTVIHLAGRAHIIDANMSNSIDEFQRVNTEATIRLFKEAAKSGVKRFIFISSIGVNGNRTYGKPFTVFDEPSPNTPYAQSKYQAELELLDLSRISDIEIVIIRPPLVYGFNAPGNFKRMMRWLASGIPLPFGGVTSNRRSFVSLDNLIDLIIVSINHPLAANQTFLVSDGCDMSTTDFFLHACNALGKKPRLLAVPPSVLWSLAKLTGKEHMAEQLLCDLQVDIQHTCKTLNWHPPFSIDEALSKSALYI